ncbi:MAG: hypothetical protein HN472_11390 [Nitrospina sp.]|jgi:hypothetical protein|nr:hypothetical protein [Nitrospina sp.]MBT3510130.1 hypothetical protein [Nitrospina sp.]MBT3877375.1 hypothetical protein [Nitrospina sp.]MBT4046754.1 hypothetical protein [Nitrospina sp.]MBT4557524.1 hypothetical protein [Nitrospina sp.]
MSCRLKIRLFPISLLFCMALFMASVAQAGTSHHHHPGKSDVISPFNKEVKPVHCVFNMHQHFRNAPCPHDKQKGTVGNSELRPDCGTHSGSSNSSSNTKDLSKITSYFEFSPDSNSQEVDLLTYDKHQKLLRLIDHPPQFI